MQVEPEKKSKWQWNWGKGIFLIYSLFVTGMLIMVFGTFRQTIDLEAPDYYAKELAFQEQIDKKNRSNALVEPLKMSIEKDRIVLDFPFEGSAIQGEIELFRPSDAIHDRKFMIRADENGMMKIPVKEMAPGPYRMKVDWVYKGIAYYDEEVMLIQENR
jgi:hypothetical protein